MPSLQKREQARRHLPPTQVDFSLLKMGGYSSATMCQLEQSLIKFTGQYTDYFTDMLFH